MKVPEMSAESGTASPNVKKMKQARLPFQVIGSDSPKLESPAPKKRKLSVQNDDIPIKVGKLSEHKENEISTETHIESVVISDDEAVLTTPEESVADVTNESNIPNPLVMFVGAALQRQLRKRTNTTEKLPKKKVTEKSPLNKTKSKKSGKKATKSSVTSETATVDNSKKTSLSQDIINLIDDDDVVMQEKISVTNNETTSEINIVPSVNEPAPIDHDSKSPPESKPDDLNTSNAESSQPDEPNECVSTPMKNVSQNMEEFTTPKTSKRLAESKLKKAEEDRLDSTLESSPNVSLEHKKLTPKQLQKKLESTKKQQEREREKQEREKKRQDEKDERNRQRLEKEEQKKKEREEKEEQKKKEREEKERLKEEEKKLREKQEEDKRNEKKREKEAKEEEKRKKEMEKEEEKRKREIEKEEEKKKKDLEREEAENKKKKASAAFVNFFVAKESKNTSECPATEKTVNNEYLSNFTIKSDMRLAPRVRNPLDEKRKTSLDLHLAEQKIEMEDLYVMKLRLKECIGKTSDKTWPLADLKNDVFIVEDNLPPIDESKEGNLIILEANPTGEILKPKLFSFSENRRPPYWGTWRRKSKFINGRKPFTLDKNLLDYSCDSDEEWEEEEPGESVGGSVAGGTDEDDEENDNEYDVDNDFMVPHGYLSEEEALGEEDQNDFSPETQKAKLKVLEYEFQNEMKKATEKLHPRLIGMYWQNADCGRPPLCAEAVWNYLNIRKILTAESQVCIASTVENNEIEADETLKNTEKSAVKKQKITESMIPELIRLVHGNTNNRGFLANEFQQYIANVNKSDENQPDQDGQKSPLPSDISKISIARKVKDVSNWMPCPEEGPMASKMCWYVSPEIREKYNMSDLELPNVWSYTLTPKRKSDTTFKQKLSKDKTVKEANDISDDTLNGKKECAFNIKKFTKQMTDEERKKQFVTSSPASISSVAQTKNHDCNDLSGSAIAEPVNSDTTAKPAVKKRVSLLFSGPRGKALPQCSDSAEKVAGKVNAANSVPSSSNETKIGSKKRVQILASAPIGQEIPKTIKTNLLTQFIKTIGKDEAKNKINSTTNDTPMETDEGCVVLSD